MSEEKAATGKVAAGNGYSANSNGFHQHDTTKAHAVILSDQAKQLLSLIWRGGEWVYLWTPNTGRYYTDKKTGERKECKDSQWFPASENPIIQASWQDRNIYFGVYPSTVQREKWQRTTNASAASMATFFGEFDVKDYGSKEAILAHLETLPLYPSAVIDSGGGFHCYWLLEHPVLLTDENRDYMRHLLYAWVDLVGSDDNAKDISRVLRLPGSRNFKPERGPDFPEVRIIEFDDRRTFPLERIEEIAGHLVSTQQERPEFERTSTLDDMAAAIDALQRLNKHRADDYADWIKIGQALKAGLGESGLALWREWSAGSAKYKEGDCESKWRSFSPDSITLGSLIYMADQDAPREKKQRKSESERAGQGGQGEQTDSATDARNLPQIVQNNRQLAALLAETQKALATYAARNPAPLLYMRGGMPVALASDEHGGQNLIRVGANVMLGLMTEIAEWVNGRWDDEAKEMKYTDVLPSATVAKVLCELPAPLWTEPLPAIARISQVPIFGSDGMLYQTTGYHAAIRTYLHIGVTLGDTTPTPENMKAAVSLILDDLLVDFPFDVAPEDNGASKAHAVALLLLAFVRELIDGPTPLHLATAPGHRVGKSLLLSVVLSVAFGFIEMSQAPGDKEEWRKVLVAKLISAPGAVCFDNIDESLDSGALASAITEPRITDRILGGNAEISAPANWVWAASAKNPVLSEELMLRSALIRLVPNTDTPESRSGFRHENLERWAHEHRSELVTACITIVRNWIENHNRKPFTARRKGRFESWVSTMGGILEAAGIDGFLGNELALRQGAAPTETIFALFVERWWEVHGERRVTTADLMALASTPETPEAPKGENLLSEIFASDKTTGRVRELGRMLSGRNGRVFSITDAEGRHVQYVQLSRPDGKARSNVSLWRLKPVENAEKQPENVSFDFDGAASGL